MYCIVVQKVLFLLFGSQKCIVCQWIVVSYYVKGLGGIYCCNIITNSIHIFIINSNTNIFHNRAIDRVGEDIISLAPRSLKT